MKKALTILSLLVILCMGFTFVAQGTPKDGTVTMPPIPIPTHTTEASSEPESSSKTETSSEQESSSETESSSEQTEPSATEPSETEPSATEPSETETSETASTSETLPEESTDYEASEIPFSTEPSTTAYDISNSSISNIAAASLQVCQLNVSWNTLSPKVSGYQIQYSTAASFSAAETKTVTVKGGTSNSVVIHRMPRDKMVYVRVRAYYNGENGTSCSKWSRVKSTTIRK